MSEHLSQFRRRVSDLLPDSMSRQQRVALAATCLVAAQLVVRAWALWGGSFYNDDFALLSLARPGLDTDLLTTPFDGELMPVPLVIAWLVAQTGAFPWAVAAGTVLVLQAVAGWAAWRMLRTIFGARYAILVPLAVFLFTPLTLTSFMWWSAALTSLPLQIALLVAITAHVRHLADRRAVHAVVAVSAVAVGLLVDPKALLFAPLLLALSVVVVAGPARPVRLWTVLRRAWPAWIGYALLTVAYVVAHDRWVGTHLFSTGGPDVVRVVGKVLGRSLGPLAVGGPLQWQPVDPPGSLADPALATIIGAALVLALTITYAVLRRRGAWAPAVLLVAYALGDAVYLALRRGDEALGVAADPRFVSDAAPVLVLVLALMFVPTRLPHLRGSVPRSPEGHRPPPALVAVTLLAGAVATGVSALSYVEPWHADYAAKTYIGHVTDTTRRTGDVDVIDVPVPDSVMIRSLYPYTLTSRFFNGDERVRPRSAGNDLRTFDRAGFLRVPRPVGGVTSPEPAAGTCGVVYSTERKPPTGSVKRPRLTLSSPGSTERTWLSIDYLASADATVTIDTGGTTRTIEVLRGAHTYVLRPDEEISAVTFTDLTPDTTLCVGTIAVAPLTATKFS